MMGSIPKGETPQAMVQAGHNTTLKLTADYRADT